MRLSTLGGCALLACTIAACTRAGVPPVEDPIAALEVSPPEYTLTTIDGSHPRVTFALVGRTVSGRTVPVEASSWSLDHERVGSIDEDGTFTTSARAGGVVDVAASGVGPTGPVTVHASLRVIFDLTIPPAPDVPPTVVDRLEGAEEIDDPFESASIEYPLEGARMPNNVPPPTVQWFPRGSGLGDAYRITLSSEHATVRAVAYDDGRTFRASLPVEPAAWRAIADSTRSAEVAIRVDRLPAGRDAIVRGEPVDVWLSEDGVFGTLFYWQVRTDPQASDVLRIDAAGGMRDSVLATEGCVGCHAISTDGRRLAATTDARATAWVTTVVDTTSATVPPPELAGPFEPAYHFFAFRPDGRRILASQAVDDEVNGHTRLALLDGETGAPIAGASGLPPGDAGYPTFSPDGLLAAWMEGGGDGTRGTSADTRIVVAPVDGDDGFGASRVLHEGSDLEDSLEGGVTDSRPTFSPDAALVAFAHGTRSVSAVDIASGPPRAGLYLVGVDGGDPIRLARGMGREGPVDAFWPVFSPFVTEEADGTRLYWLAFYSRQDYGNVRAGTADTDRRQLWVMAIDPARAALGEDPSYAPYWLPGQDTLDDNIAALWAPTSCRGQDEHCSASSECCSGECAAADPSMPDVLTCRPPPVCRRAGESCETEDDCCVGVCNLGVCGYTPPD